MEGSYLKSVFGVSAGSWAAVADAGPGAGLVFSGVFEVFEGADVSCAGFAGSGFVAPVAGPSLAAGTDFPSLLGTDFGGAICTGKETKAA